MKASTKLLIIASACLIAFSLAACGDENSHEENTTPAWETVTTGVAQETSGGEEDTAADESADSQPAAGTQSPDTTDPAEPVESETVGKTDETNEVVGPIPPTPETEPQTEAPTEPAMPDFGDVETNEDGVIELPFVPFPED